MESKYDSDSSSDSGDAENKSNKGNEEKQETNSESEVEEEAGSVTDDDDNTLNTQHKSFSKTEDLNENVQNTIFVGNLPNTISLKEVKTMFRKFGKVMNARLRCAIRKELKIPKKLAIIKKDFHEDSNHISAYVKFENFKDCKTALKMNGHVYNGHHLRVSLAAEGKNKDVDSKRSIFLGNLSFKIQDDDLWGAFEDCGQIESVRIIRDVKTGIGKGFGYVNFMSADAVELALRLDGVSVLDRPVRVSRTKHGPFTKKRTEKTKPSTPGVKAKSNESVKPSGKDNKKWEKVKAKREFQGRRTKLSLNKKSKKKKKFDKKKMIIKNIADGLAKKKKT